MVTRDSKIDLQIKSIERFSSYIKKNKSLLVIGTEKYQKKAKIFNTKFVGYVEQNNILKYSNSIFVADGYGEGIPHNLVDAIVSGADIYLSKKNFINFGFYKHIEKKEYVITGDWIKITKNQKLVELCKIKNVDFIIKDALTKCLF